MSHRYPDHSCPCCSGKLDKYIDYLDGHTLLEERWKCQTCAYVNEYAFGAMRVIVGGKEWQWTWNTPNPKVVELHKEINDAIDSAKKDAIDKGIWRA